MSLCVPSMTSPAAVTVANFKRPPLGIRNLEPLAAPSAALANQPPDDWLDSALVAVLSIVMLAAAVPLVASSVALRRRIWMNFTRASVTPVEDMMSVRLVRSRLTEEDALIVERKL